MRPILASEFDEYVNNLRIIDDEEDGVYKAEGKFKIIDRMISIINNELVFYMTLDWDERFIINVNKSCKLEIKVPYILNIYNNKSEEIFFTKFKPLSKGSSSHYLDYYSGKYNSYEVMNNFGLLFGDSLKKYNNKNVYFIIYYCDL